MDKVKRSKRNKELAQKAIQEQLFKYVINEEITRVFDIDKSLKKTTEEQGENLAFLFM